MLLGPVSHTCAVSVKSCICILYRRIMHLPGLQVRCKGHPDFFIEGTGKAPVDHASSDLMVKMCWHTSNTGQQHLMACAATGWTMHANPSANKPIRACSA